MCAHMTHMTCQSCARGQSIYILPCAVNMCRHLDHDSFMQIVVPITSRSALQMTSILLFDLEVYSTSVVMTLVSELHCHTRRAVLLFPRREPLLGTCKPLSMTTLNYVISGSLTTILCRCATCLKNLANCQSLAAIWRMSLNLI